MESLKQRSAELNQMIADLKWLEATDKFYDEKIVSHENEDEPTVGLEQYRNGVIRFQKDVKNASATLKNTLVGDDVSVAEWHYVFDHPQMGRMDYIQVSVQRWKNGKIIHERHHYKTPQW